MNFPHSYVRALFAASLIAACSGNSPAQTTVATVPEGFMNFTIPAGSATTPSVFTFSLPLTLPAPANFVGKAAGTISSVTATTISNTTAAWAAGALSQAVSPYFIRIKTGAAVGRTLLISTTAGQENTSTTVTVDNQGTPLDGLGIVAGDAYEVFPADTLFSLFGSDIQGGTSAATADVVRLQSGGSWNEYYYNSTVAQWRLGSIPVSQNNVVIRPDSGIIFYRKGTTPLALTLTGRVPSTDLQLVLNEVGSTFTAGFPVDTLLSQSDFNSMPTWVNNTGSVTNADKVDIFVNGSWNSYNYNQAAGQWRLGSVPVNVGPSVTISAGAPAIIESPTGTAGLKVWRRTLPYTLSAN